MKGLFQGSSLSPLFSNLYLTSMDRYLEENGLHFIRFGDDIKIFVKTFEIGMSTLEQVSTYLKNKLFVEVNKSKCGVHLAVKRTILGYRLISTDNSIEAVKYKRDYKTIYNNWHTSAIGDSGNDYFILADGILTRKDYSLLFENEKNKMDIPIQNLGSLNIYSNVTISSNFFNMANSNNLRLSFFDKFGEYIGSFIPVNQYRNTKTFLTQSTMYNEDFQSTQRSRRPPKDPINSLISFGNALMYRQIAKEIYKCSKR